MAPKVTVKELRAEARRRLLECGNGKTISRMNKRELLSFISCIHHPDADRLGGDDLGDSMVGMFKEPKQRKRRKRKPVPADSDDEPDDFDPVQTEPDDVSGILLQRGRGLPNTYRAFVKAMLPRAQREHDGPNAMRAVAKMWQQHKQQRGRGLSPAGAVSGRGLTLAGGGTASNISSGAKGTAAALGLAGLAQPEFAPILEPAAAVSAGVGYIADLFK